MTNSICSATFCESAALGAEPSQSSLRDASSPEGGAFAHLPVSVDKAPPSGELANAVSLRGLAFGASRDGEGEDAAGEPPSIKIKNRSVRKRSGIPTL